MKSTRRGDRARSEPSLSIAAHSRRGGPPAMSMSPVHDERTGLVDVDEERATIAGSVICRPPAWLLAASGWYHHRPRLAAGRTTPILASTFTFRLATHRWVSASEKCEACADRRRSRRVALRRRGRRLGADPSFRCRRIHQDIANAAVAATLRPTRGRRPPASFGALQSRRHRRGPKRRSGTVLAHLSAMQPPRRGCSCLRPGADRGHQRWSRMPIGRSVNSVDRVTEEFLWRGGARSRGTPVADRRQRIGGWSRASMRATRP
jgi:hypothetical protein